MVSFDINITWHHMVFMIGSRQEMEIPATAPVPAVPATAQRKGQEAKRKNAEAKEPGFEDGHGISMDWFSREILQESPIFNGKIYGFRLRFSLKPIH
jgi:hypothetical protein